MSRIIGIIFLSGILFSFRAEAGTKLYNSQAEYTSVLYVGDSRTVGLMQAADDSEASYICEVGKGLAWLREHAGLIPETGDGAALVIALGVNDLGNAGGYIKFLNERVRKWKAEGYRTYFMSVNPVGPGSSIAEEDVDRFNARLRNGLSEDWLWIETCQELKEDGFSSADGLHYSSTTYRKIHETVKEAVYD